MEIYCYNPRAREKLQLGWRREQELQQSLEKQATSPNQSIGWGLLFPRYGGPVLPGNSGAWVPCGQMAWRMGPSPPLIAPWVSALGSCWPGVHIGVLLPAFFPFSEAGADPPQTLSLHENSIHKPGVLSAQLFLRYWGRCKREWCVPAPHTACHLVEEARPAP